jgi:hypothetical protein
MTRSIAAASVLALALTTGGSTSASGWGSSCGDEAVGVYGPPPPVYVYDHQSGPTWTGNGWAYLPIGQYYPRPGIDVPLPPPPVPRRHPDIIPDPRLLLCLLPF